MKLTSPMVAAISIAVLLCIVQAYVDMQWFGASGEIARLKAANAQQAAQINAVQGAVDGYRETFKRMDALIGPKGTVKAVTDSLASGDLDLSVKSLTVVSNGKPVVAIGLRPDAGGLITVSSSDGSSSAELAAAPGKSTLALKAATGPDSGRVNHAASLGSDGLTLQKGADPANPTDLASLSIADVGSNFSMTQVGGGSVSIDTSSVGAHGRLMIWEDGSPKRSLSLSTGEGAASPFLSLSGAASGYSATIVPDRLSLINKDGAVTLLAAGDENGGFFIANDKGGERRAILASGIDGHGTVGVFGADGRSNTLYPEYNIQKSSSTQK